MCLVVTKQGIEKLEQIKKAGKTVTVYKLLECLEDGQLCTPFQYAIVKPPSTVYSNRIQTKTPHRVGTRIQKGLHFYISLHTARRDSAEFSCGGEYKHQIWEAKVEPNDIIAIGKFDDTAIGTLAAYKAKLVRRITRK